MSANGNNSQAIFYKNDEQSTAGISLKIGSEEIKCEDQVKLVGYLSIANYHTMSIY